MARVDNRYSRFVQWAKIVFPLVALGLLSTMFLFSRSLDPSSAIPFAEIDIEKIAREQQLTAPRFSGTTSDGSAITVDAESAVPDLTDVRRLTIKKVVARIEAEAGPSYGIIANTAFYDGRVGTLDLEGDVRLSTSTGYNLQTQKLVANLEATGLEAPGALIGRGPAGQIEAGSMKLTANGNTQVLVFKDGVKLVYDPKE
ncbi:LPS export ABC transporter periplasmic protein LptC [Litoreibacter janthinus]|uniref:Lipopolysaccharide export system protein LptC n=1 Tax=Litoreibacter janthinus TaxID=670154 RepID=A0A1I6FYV8_9RHOB|nr:LPS export ABC transporter periplasmic protein LptC [Litoreibacter janthinus]SFR35129.1 lipopolysaccharide export system protein LptC [Litoreibacter janthinus]